MIKRYAQSQQLLPDHQIYEWFVQVLYALVHIHKHSIVHRDLKSANVLLHSPSQVKVADFGISKLLTETCKVARTVIGTPAYFAPELCDSSPYDAKCDMWGLGIILYELCALRLPFDGNNILALVKKITTAQPPPLPDAYAGTVFPLFVSLLLQKKAARRPSSAEFLETQIEKGILSEVGLRIHDSVKKEKANKVRRTAAHTDRAHTAWPEGGGL